MRVSLEALQEYEYNIDKFFNDNKPTPTPGTTSWFNPAWKAFWIKYKKFVISERRRLGISN